MMYIFGGKKDNSVLNDSYTLDFGMLYFFRVIYIRS